MKLSDDYPGEMERFSPERFEAILSGDVPESVEAAQVAAFVQDVRRTLLEGPADELAAQHLAAMAAARREMAAFPPNPLRRRPPMRIFSGRRVAVLGLAAGMTLTGGLAWAGALPTPAQDAIAGVASHVGIDLPSSDDETTATDNHGAEVSQVAQDPTLEGCEKGQAVASVASEPSLDHRQDTVDKQDPCAQGDEGSGSADEGAVGPPADVPRSNAIPDGVETGGPPSGAPSGS